MDSLQAQIEPLQRQLATAKAQLTVCGERNVAAGGSLRFTPRTPDAMTEGMAVHPR